MNLNVKRAQGIEPLATMLIWQHIHTTPPDLDTSPVTSRQLVLTPV